MNKSIALSLIVVLLSITLVNAVDCGDNYTEALQTKETICNATSCSIYVDKVLVKTYDIQTDKEKIANLTAQVTELNKKVEEHETLLQKIKNFFKGLF